MRVERSASRELSIERVEKSASRERESRQGERAENKV